MIKNIKKQDDEISPLIDEYMLHRDKSQDRAWDFPASVEDRFRGAGKFSPSSICGCPRQAAFKYLGVKGKKLIDPDMETVFDDGKWRHLRLDWQIHDMEAVLGRDKWRVISVEEDVVYPKLKIAGSLDAVVAVHGKPLVIDFKGINTNGFGWVFKEQKPKRAHVLQLIAYQKMRKIRRGAIWYEDKNDGRTLIMSVNWTPELWEEVDTWCRDILKQMDRERLPLKTSECKQGYYMYGRCTFAGTCFGDLTEAQIERKAFRGFDGVEAAWNTRK